MLRLFLFLFVFNISLPNQEICAQSPSVWSVLSMVRYQHEYDPNLGIEKTIPEFSKKVKELNSQEVTLKGYIIPLEGKKSQSYFMFSAFPYSSCFFCGAAGPESVVEVTMSKGKKIQYTSKQITIKGTFSYQNPDDQGVFYSIKNATILTK